jgi:hypothetical protein
MAERSNAAVLKTVVRLTVDRGFESLFLRKRKEIPGRSLGILLFGQAQACLRPGQKAKDPPARSTGGDFLSFAGTPLRGS